LATKWPAEAQYPHQFRGVVVISVAVDGVATGDGGIHGREPLVRVDDLTVDYRNDDEWVSVVKNVSFEIGRGETLGLAGESGCGKTTTALAMFGYHKPGSRVAGGRVTFDGRDLLGLSDRQMQPIRGARISLVPQNPASTLTPSMKVGHQVIETLEAHGVSSGSEAMARAVELFGQVGLPEPAEIARRYPHQLSGGQQQRVVIAVAVACRPDLIVLDEPTTALDVTTQARLLELLNQIKTDSGMSALYVSHNLGVLEQICDRVAVMYAGELIEIAPTAELFNQPRHPYTRGLIAAVPRVEAQHAGTEKLRGLLRRDDLPDGCGFAPRCPYSRPQCFTDPQRLDEIEPSHQVACWRAPDIESEAGAP
jgi:oligopeptide/dipeptide ABC transporter ATP-binding protein